MSETTTIKVPKVSLGEQIKENIKAENVFVFYKKTAIQKSIINVFKNLAKGLKRDIALIDYTSSNVFDIVKEIKTIPEEVRPFMIFLPNTSKMKDYNPLVHNVKFEDKTYITNFYDFQFSYLSSKSVFISEKKWKYIQCSHGYNCCEVSKNTMKWFPDIFTEKLDNKSKVLLTEKILEKFKVIYPMLLDPTLEKAFNIADIHTKFQQRIPRIMKDFVMSRIRNAQRDMEVHFDAVQKREREIRADDKLYNSLPDKIDEKVVDLKRATETVVRLLKSGKIKNINYGVNSLEIHTGKVGITNYKKVFMIGEFRITIELTGKVTFKNLTNPFVDSDKVYDHPHILNGTACFGNIVENVQKLISKGDFLNLIELLWEFLNTYYEGDRYRCIEQGWGTKEDWCVKCNRPSRSCPCNNICTGCECHIDDCECERCPMSNSLISEMNCPECDYWKSEQEACNYE